MCEVELIEGVPNTSPRRYRVASSDVVRERFELKSALNSVGEYLLSTRRSSVLPSVFGAVVRSLVNGRLFVRASRFPE